MKSNFALRNFGEPPRPKSKAEIKEEIEKKYGLGCYYYSAPKLIKTYDDQASTMYSEYLTNVNNKLFDHVKITVKYSGVGAGVENYNYYWAEQAYLKTIRNAPHVNVFDQTDKFGQILKNYRSDLDKYGPQIHNAPSMQDADRAAEKLYSFHDSTYPHLCAKSKEVIHDFEVSLTGIPFDTEAYNNDFG